MKPPRLVLIARRFWPMVGGSTKSLARLAAELVDCGCQATVLTVGWSPRWPKELAYGNVPVVRLSEAPRTSWSTFQYTRAIKHWLRNHFHEYDLVYVSGLREEAGAAIKAVRGRRPVVLRAEETGRHGDCVWQLEARGGYGVKKRCLAADALVGPTPAVIRELKAAGYPPDRTHEIPDGVPIPPPPSWDRQAAARDALGAGHPAMRMPQWTPLVVYAGRLTDDRGLDVLLSAWETVAADWPQARLWLVGEGAYETALREQIELRSLTGRVLLAGIFDDIEEILAAANVYVLPSREGRGSLSLIEAMAAGLPTVATDLPDHRQLSASSGVLLVPPGDASALAGAMQRLLKEPDLGIELGMAGRQRAAAEFPLARMVRKHLQLFESLLGPPGSGPTRAVSPHRLERS